MGLRPNLSIGLPLSDASNLSTVSDYFSICDLHRCIFIKNNRNKIYVIILIAVSIKRTIAVGRRSPLNFMLRVSPSGTSETLGREIWGSALANLLLMAAAKSEV